MVFTSAEINNEALRQQPAKQEAAVPKAPEAASAKPSELPLHVQETLDRAVKAQEEFLKLGQADVDRIFDFVANEANKHRLPLAKLAVKETRMGQTEDKVIKNGIACEVIHDRYKHAKTCGLIASDKAHGTYTYAFPAGPICAITPVTNPTSTAIAKSLLMCKTRNTGVFLPHPRASDCTAEAVRICCEAGVKAGAPANWVQCIEHPTMDISRMVMESPEIELVLATGGPGVVEASYKSGKPAIGVGGGNAPVLIDERADLQTACGSLVLGKTFDNGVICAAEQSAVVVDEAYDKFKELLQARGVFFLEGQERERLAAFIHKDGRINPDIVGQTALEIAKLAGLKGEIPPHTVVLATEETEIGPHNPLSAEKLSPVLSLFRAKDFEDGLQLCRDLALHGGIGHTGGFYTDDEGGSSARVEAYVKCVPVGRVIVNAPTSLTAIGTAFNFAVDPSFTLGVGTHAGSSVSAALTPTHLLNTVIAAERQKHMEWFNLPKRIFFNRGCLEEALQSCAGPDENGLCTTRAIVVTDPGMVQCGHVDRLVDALKKIGHTVDVFSAVSPDPDMACIRRGVKACESFRPDIMFCLGGGSPIDAGKFIRVQYEHPDLTVDQAATRFIELRKRTNPFPKMGSMIRKLIAIPTTSGTGSEVSPFTVITGDDGMKYPIASYHLTPDMAICDSTFCDGLPQGLIANAGIDAVTHAIEAYVSVAQNDFTKQHCIEALKLLFANLPTSYNVGTPKSRDRVHRGATIAGIAFSNSFLGVCHSLAHKVGAHFHLPHGMTNSILLPHVIRYNATDTPTRMGVYPSYNYPKAVKRYGELAQAVGASSNTAEGLIEELKKLSQALHLPQSFKEAGVSKEEYVAALDEIAEDAFDDQCTPCNPRFPLIPELKEVLMNAYE